MRLILAVSVDTEAGLFFRDSEDISDKDKRKDTVTRTIKAAVSKEPDNAAIHLVVADGALRHRSLLLLCLHWDSQCRLSFGVGFVVVCGT